MMNCPSCNTPLTLTLAAETAKVERGWVVRSVPHGLFISPKPMWHNRIDDECVYSTPFKACETYRNHRGQILEVHRINGEWRLVDDKPEPAKVAEPTHDRHGRKIIKRDGHAMIVLCRDGAFDVTSSCSDYWFHSKGVWNKNDDDMEFGNWTDKAAESRLAKAAATPLPIEKPAEAKVPIFSNCTQGQIIARLDELEARLAKVEGKNL